MSKPKHISEAWIMIEGEIMVTNTVTVPIIMTGFRPKRSAMIPQITDVKALPSMYEEPSKI